MRSGLHLPLGTVFSRAVVATAGLSLAAASADGAGRFLGAGAVPGPTRAPLVAGAGARDRMQHVSTTWSAARTKRSNTEMRTSRRSHSFVGGRLSSPNVECRSEHTSEHQTNQHGGTRSTHGVSVE